MSLSTVIVALNSQTLRKYEPEGVEYIVEKHVAKDPVCGMEVNEQTAEHKAAYNGKTYYFCSAGCKEAFEANPRKYAKG